MLRPRWTARHPQASNLIRVTSRWRQARESAGARGIDAVVLTPGANLRYLTGYYAKPLERLTAFVAESGHVRSLEVVEVNPILDRENQTAKLAVELVASALGARIL